MELVADLDFEEAVFGVQARGHAAHAGRVRDLRGHRRGAGHLAGACAECDGAGEVRRVRQSILGQMVTARPCSRCGGIGQEIPSPCTDCRGDGRRTEERTYTVDVPAGVDNGTTLRLAGRGAAGPRGGPTGDLYVHLRVQPHDRFDRDGFDLVHVLHVPMTQAALGAHMPFETLDGNEDLVIPAGTQTGREFRLRGRGVPHLEGRGRGDLLVRAVVDTPTDLRADEEELLRQLADRAGRGGGARRQRPVLEDPLGVQVASACCRPPRRTSSSPTSTRPRSSPTTSTTSSACCGCARRSVTVGRRRRPLAALSRRSRRAALEADGDVAVEPRPAAGDHHRVRHPQGRPARVGRAEAHRARRRSRSCP